MNEQQARMLLEAIKSLVQIESAMVTRQLMGLETERPQVADKIDELFIKTILLIHPRV